ncbi:hypothetical protein RISK_001710 [Rhodopirellula islandica]|uniref:Uncharacterized protein n=1 Tax=Rhodopirellula islandica TaxID=595434 RepID=A0A0J1ELU4_RHOIS|nr:hypothetical protein RISK_001710 [Rhodopirellula islandica]
MEDAELLCRVTPADGNEPGRDEAWHLRAARRNSWGQLFYSGAMHFYAYETHRHRPGRGRRS